MPKHSSGNFKNSNNNISSDHHQQQPQHFPQQQDQLRGGTHLSYENLSSTVPSGGAHSTTTNNQMYFQQHENSHVRKSFSKSLIFTLNKNEMFSLLVVNA